MRFLALLALFSLPAISQAAPGHDHGPAKAKGPPGPGAILAAVIKPYLKVRQALVQDDLPEARKWAGMLMRSANTHHLPELAKSALRFKDADLPAARHAFVDVSAIVIAAIEAFPPARAALKVYDCKAAPGRWLQVGSAPTNPYHSGKLRECGVEIPISPDVQAAADAMMAAPPKDAEHDHGDGNGRHAH